MDCLGRDFPDRLEPMGWGSQNIAYFHSDSSSSIWWLLGKEAWQGKNCNASHNSWQGFFLCCPGQGTLDTFTCEKIKEKIERSGLVFERESKWKGEVLMNSFFNIFWLPPNRGQDIIIKNKAAGSFNWRQWIISDCIQETPRVLDKIRRRVPNFYRKNCEW